MMRHTVSPMIAAERRQAAIVGQAVAASRIGAASASAAVEEAVGTVGEDGSLVEQLNTLRQRLDDAEIP